MYDVLDRDLSSDFSTWNRSRSLKKGLDPKCHPSFFLSRDTAFPADLLQHSGSYLWCMHLQFLPTHLNGRGSCIKSDGKLQIIMGHISHPKDITHFYGATKYAVTALTEGIRHELQDQKSHIRVTSISPGLVETEFAYRMFERTSLSASQLYSTTKVLEAKDISSAVVFVLGAPPHMNVGEIIIRPVQQRM